MQQKLGDFFFLIILFICFIFGCAGSSLLLELFSSCGDWGLLSGCDAWPSHFSGFSCGAWVLGAPGFSSGVWAQQLQFLGSRA